MSTDNIADMLTRIRNAYLARKKTVDMPYTNLKKAIADIMLQEKYIEAVSVEENDKGFKTLKLELKYIDGKPAVHSIKRISKPGLRIYTSSNKITPVLSGLGISIISTSKGLMTNKEAKKQNIGGEVLCELW